MPRTKLQPLKGKKKFDELFKESKKFKVKDSLALIKFKDDEFYDNPGLFRIIFYAVIISKKIAKKAVVRNRVKRLLRESLRQLLKENEKLFDKIQCVIVIWRWAPKRPKLIHLKDVKPVVGEMLNKANLYSLNKEEKRN